MSEVYLDLDRDDDDLIVGNASPIHINCLQPHEAKQIQGARESARVLTTIPKARWNGRLDAGKLSPIPEVAERVSQASGFNAPAMNLESIFAPQVVNNELGNAVRLRMGGESPEDIQDAQESIANAVEDLENYALSEHSVDEMVEAMDLTTEEVIENVATRPFPNLAREIMTLGLGLESFQTENRLKRYKLEADQCKVNIDTLLKLSAQLPKMNSDDLSYELKNEAKEEIHKLVVQLREKGIDIFPGLEIGKDLGKDQLASANSLINHHIDLNKTKLQELFTTKIAVAIQFMTMIGEVMKKVSEKDDQLKRKTLEQRG